MDHIKPESMYAWVAEDCETITFCRRAQSQDNWSIIWSNRWLNEAFIDIVRLTGLWTAFKWVDYGVNNNNSTQQYTNRPTEKDLDVLITSDLKSGDQCEAAYMKDNKMLGLIKRTGK